MLHDSELLMYCSSPETTRNNVTVPVMYPVLVWVSPFYQNPSVVLGWLPLPASFSPWQQSDSEEQMFSTSVLFKISVCVCFSAPSTPVKCSLRTWWWSEAPPCCPASCTACWQRFASWWRNPNTVTCWPARASVFILPLQSPTALRGLEVRYEFKLIIHAEVKACGLKNPSQSSLLIKHTVSIFLLLSKKKNKFVAPLVTFVNSSPGAIFGALQDILGSRSVSRDYYNQMGRIPDWCCLSSPPPESLYEAGKTPPPLMKRAFSTEK